MVYYIILLICDIHVYIMPRPSKYPWNLSCTTVLIRLPIFGWWLEDLGDGIDTLDYVYSCISFPVLYADNSLFKFEWHLNCMCTWILTWDSIETMAVWAQGCWHARVFHQWKACSNWRIWRPTGNHCFVHKSERIAVNLMEPCLGTKHWSTTWTMPCLIDHEGWSVHSTDFHWDRWSL